ncbi:MAG: hypothetical protein HYU30_10145 [Chloroflexi bacterium]|nr:hypothetical protein [Chloroflexota bacterium]
MDWYLGDTPIRRRRTVRGLRPSGLPFFLKLLGFATGRQHLDWAHIMSDIATLTRLGFFCETQSYAALSAVVAPHW